MAGIAPAVIALLIAAICSLAAPGGGSAVQLTPPALDSADSEAGHLYTTLPNPAGFGSAIDRRQRAALGADQDALVALYNATGGDDWIDNSNWMTGKPLGSWHGITTDSAGRVRRLELIGNNLTGHIPDQLDNLTELNVLDLGDNRLTGSVPASLGQLTKLMTLNLYRNLLSGPIPVEITGAARLTVINLGVNRLSGPLPPEIGQLAELRQLTLQTNRLTGPIPPQVTGNLKLEVLDLGDNDFSGSIPGQIGRLSELRQVQLQENGFSGSIPESFGDLLELYYLRLDHNQLSGPVPRQLGRLEKMQTLLLNGNLLSGPLPPHLGAMTMLDFVYVGGNNLTGCAPAHWFGVRVNDLGRSPHGPCPFGLAGLMPSPGALHPPFDIGWGDYAVHVGFGTTQLTLEALAGPATVTFLDRESKPIRDADRRAPGHQVPLSGPEKFVLVRATSDDGEQADYRVRIVRGFPSPITVKANRYVQAPGNEDLKHNIPDLEVVIGGQVLGADFLTHFLDTGQVERWGYPTSEVLVLEPNTLTQFYQRGVVDFHRVGNDWIVERRLAWDYVGGGLGGSVDQGVEPDVLNPNPGRVLGPWGHKVSNFAIDGTRIGFADYFERLGGVAAFGFPKTDARREAELAGGLRIPGATAGFIRQYFQSAVLEFHPYDAAAPVKLTLLGDTLRGRLVEGWENEPAFGRAQPLVRDQVYRPGIVGRGDSRLEGQSDMGEPVLDPVALLDGALEGMIAAESAAFEIRGRWFGPGCANPFYRWSDYLIGDFGDGGTGTARFESGRREYWYIGGVLWRKSGNDWVRADTSRVIEEIGWLPGWTDPLPRFRHVIDSFDAAEFATSQGAGTTGVRATGIPVLGEWTLREFYVTIDDATGVVSEFGWTQRQSSSVCFKSLSARNGEYGIELAIPESLR